MTTHHKDDCPCGSGKRYKHCHMDADQARSRRGWIAAVGVVAALVVGIAAWGVVTQWQANQQAGTAGGPGDSLAVRPGAGGMGGGGDVAGTTSPAPTGAFGGLVPGQNSQAPGQPVTAGGRTLPMGGGTAIQPGENAVPWQYDVAGNRHYDPRPGHQHWHSGPPPSDTTQAATTTGGSNPTVTVGGGGAVTVGGGSGRGLTPSVTTTTSPMTSSGSQALAPGENPAPWEYDKAKDRHFDPRDAHRHWHSGPPPAPSARGN